MPLIRALTIAVLGLPLLASTSCLSDSNDNDSNTSGNNGAPALTLERIGRFASGGFDEGAAEIVAYDPPSQRLFVTNADAGRIDVLDITDPANPNRVGSIDAADRFAASGGINSVAVANGIVAAAVENEDGAQAGMAQLYNASDLSFRAQVAVGVLPDAITFTHDGDTVLVANEGEPLDDYSVDPLGTVSIVEVTDPGAPDADSVGFSDFNSGGARAAELPADVRKGL